MNWNSVNDQKQDALLTTFYMLIMMVLMVIRTGLDIRGISFPPPLPPQQDNPLRSVDLRPSPPPDEYIDADYLDHLYDAALTLLCAAKAVARQLANTIREIHEFMNQAHTLAQSLRGQVYEMVTTQTQRAERLDSS